MIQILNGQAGEVVVTSDTSVIFQQVVTDNAEPLQARDLLTGFVLTASDENLGTVYFYPTNQTDKNKREDGTGSGYPLRPGASMAFSLSNTSAIAIAGIDGDVVFVKGE